MIDSIADGVLPDHILQALADGGAITAATPFADRQIQPASLDLRLGDFAYRVRASFLPGQGRTVSQRLSESDLVLHKLGLYEENKDEHTAILWVGNERTGLWMKMHAMSPPSAILNAIRKAQQDRGV